MADGTHMDKVLRIVFRFSRILGTFPFNHYFQVNAKTVIRSLAILIFISFCSSIDLFHFHTRRIIKIVITISANLLSYVVLIVRKRDVLLLYKALKKVEEDMLNDGLHYKWLPGHFRMYLSFYVFMIMVSVTAVVRYDPSNNSQTLYMIVSYMFTFSLTLSIIIQFSTLQRLLSSLFDELLKSKNVNTILVILTNLHSASTAVKAIYGLQILFYTTAIFVFMVCNIYYELRCEHPMATMIIHRVWIFLISCPLMEIIFSSNNTVAKARKVNEELYEKFVQDITNSPNQNDLLEFHLTCGKELEFDACGVFRLDNSLLCSMIACATTYMVILMQYTNPMLTCEGTSSNSSEFHTSI